MHYRPPRPFQVLPCLLQLTGQLGQLDVGRTAQSLIDPDFALLQRLEPPDRIAQGPAPGPAGRGSPLERGYEPCRPLLTAGAGSGTKRYARTLRPTAFTSGDPDRRAHGVVAHQPSRTLELSS